MLSSTSPITVPLIAVGLTMRVRRLRASQLARG